MQKHNKIQVKILWCIPLHQVQGLWYKCPVLRQPWAKDFSCIYMYKCDFTGIQKPQHTEAIMKSLKSSGALYLQA